MKKLFYILMFLFPVVTFAQQPWYKYSPSDYAWKNVGSAGFSSGGANYTSLAFNPINGQPYVAYEDAANSDKATVMMFNGTNWVNVGNAGFSAGEANWISLAFSPTGEPYVAYEDYGNYYYNKATVMKFDGTNWAYVGKEGFSDADVMYTSLAFNPTDSLPYVAYQDWANSFKATVTKFDGTNWMYVGTAGFSEGQADNLSLAFNPSGQPYVAYEDYAHSRSASVMKFDGTNWVFVGNYGFTFAQTEFESLAFSPSGQPYVAFEDATGWAMVMDYNGTNWVSVGNEDFSNSEAYYESLAFSPSDGEPYLAYEDVGNSNKATVMMFTGTNWVNVGNAGFSAGEANWTSLAFSPTGGPYVAYADWGNGIKATVMKYDSVMVGINELRESKFSLYPNPATDKITVETTGETQDSYLAILNFEGEQLMKSQITQPKTEVDVSSLPSGVYCVRLTNDRAVGIGKFIKK